MKKIRFKIILLSLLFISVGSSLHSQDAPKILFFISNGDFIANVDNYFRIVAQQNQPFSKNQIISSTIIFGKRKLPINIEETKGWFIIHPDTTGIIELIVKLRDTVMTKSASIKPMPAVARLSKYGANSDEKIGVAEFKAQMGIVAQVECCGFDARCKVYGYEVIRVSAQNKVERNINIGGKFDDVTRKIIHNAQSRDLFIFRNIRYSCADSKLIQRLDDMTFVIK